MMVHLTVAWFHEWHNPQADPAWRGEEMYPYIATRADPRTLDPRDQIIFSLNRMVRTDQDRKNLLDDFLDFCRGQRIDPDRIENLQIDDLRQPLLPARRA